MREENRMRERSSPKFSVYKYFGITGTNICGLPMTILAFGKGSVRRDYYLCSGH